MQRRTLWLVIGILGCVAFVTLTCLGGLIALMTLFSGPRSLTATQTLPMVSAVVVGPVLGIPLIVQGWAGWRGRPSRPFTPPRAWWLGFMLLAALLALGAVVSLRSLAPALLLPPIHVLAMALPPLLVLWLVGRALRGRGGSWRDVIAGMAGGGFLGTTAALIGEGLLIFAIVIIVTIIVMATPGGLERIQELASRMQDPEWMTDVQNLLPVLLSPAVVLSVLGILSIPVPLIEEGVKTLATGVAGRWVRPTAARAFLWGVAGGAGFALAENLFNGALGGVEGWLPGAIARFGATVMHCFTGGLVGWGWGQLWTAPLASAGLLRRRRTRPRRVERFCRGSGVLGRRPDGPKGRGPSGHLHAARHADAPGVVGPVDPDFPGCAHRRRAQIGGSSGASTGTNPRCDNP